MNWQQLALVALLLWAAIMTAAYFREYVRHKRLYMDLDKILIWISGKTLSWEKGDSWPPKTAETLDQVARKIEKLLIRSFK